MDATIDRQLLRRETITYLGKLPDSIEKNPEMALASTCITIGNFLKWIAPILEERNQPIFPGLTNQPPSLSETGEKMRQIGLELWDKPVPKPSWFEEISSLKTTLARIENSLGKNGRGK
jgi:hypothetical protein